MADMHDRVESRLAPAPDGTVEVATEACKFARLLVVEQWGEVKGSRDWTQEAKHRTQELGSVACNDPDTIIVNGNIWVRDSTKNAQLARDYQGSIVEADQARQREGQVYGNYQAWYQRIAAIVDDILANALVTVEANKNYPGFPLHNHQPDYDNDPRQLRHAYYRGYDAAKGAIMLQEPNGDLRVVSVFVHINGRKTSQFDLRQAAKITSIDYIIPN